MNRPWMPLYIGEYLAETAHLTHVERSAYVLLMAHYWTKGELPENEDTIRRIAQLSPYQWKRSRDNLRGLFVKDFTRWTHGGLQRELAHVIEISETRSANALRMHLIRRASAVQVHPHTQRRKKEREEAFEKERKEGSLRRLTYAEVLEKKRGL